MGAWKKPKRNQGCPARTAQKAPHLGQATETGAFCVTPGQVNLAHRSLRLHKESPVAGFSCAFLNDGDRTHHQKPPIADICRCTASITSQPSPKILISPCPGPTRSHPRTPQAIAFITANGRSHRHFHPPRAAVRR